MPTATNRGNTPDKSEMKACPFCGGVAMTRFESMEQVWSALCQSCEAALSYVAYSETGAIAVWNTRASSRPPADQVPDMVEEEFWHDCRDVPDLDTSRHAVRRAIAFTIAALQAVPAASEVGEELGECELCSKPLALGQFVNVYDDIGTAHANCEQPFAKPSEPTPAPGDDGTTMPTFVLLGEPALLETVEERLLTATEEAELVERINANPNLQPFPEPPALKASGEE